MLDYIGNFKEAIKRIERDVNIKLGFIKNGVTYFIDGESVQDLKYRAEGKKALGCIVRKVINTTLMVTAETEFLEKGDCLNLFYVCEGECKVDAFFISTLVKNERNQTFKIEAQDYLSYTKDTPVPFVSMGKNLSLLNFLSMLCQEMNINHTVDGTVVNQMLKLAYLKSFILQEVLEEIAGGLNGVISTRIKNISGAYIPMILPFYLNQATVEESVYLQVSPFRIGTSAEELTFQNSLLGIEKIDDDSEKYSSVSVSLFNPTASKEDKDLGNFTRQVPGSATVVNMGTIEFQNPCLPRVICLDDNVDINDFNVTIDKCSLNIKSNNVINRDVLVEFNGFNLSKLSNYEQAESNVKIVNNVYIQSPVHNEPYYDSRIFLNDAISVKYTGNPLLEVGDTVLVDGDNVLITEHELIYTGSLRGTLKGVIING